ncbi:hypothetical protein BJV77DRAFT_1024399, partial [Russula vinacea]
MLFLCYSMTSKKGSKGISAPLSAFSLRSAIFTPLCIHLALIFMQLGFHYATPTTIAQTLPLMFSIPIPVVFPFPPTLKTSSQDPLLNLIRQHRAKSKIPLRRQCQNIHQLFSESHLSAQTPPPSQSHSPCFVRPRHTVPCPAPAKCGAPRYPRWHDTLP